MSDERKPALVAGYFVGTCTGWDQIDDWAVVLYNFEAYEGFEMINGDLVIDYQNGTFSIHDDHGTAIDAKNFVATMNGFVAREHHNKKKAASANAIDA